MNEASDIRDTLAQLDRRLGEIRQRVVTIVEAADPELQPQPSAGQAPANEAHAHRPEANGPERHGGAPGLEPHAHDREPPPDKASQLSTDIERLQTLRHRLIREARELIRSYECEIDALEAAPPRPALFEGDVTLVVNGVQEIQSLAALEASLRGAESIEQAQVSHYEPGEVTIDLRLSGPTELTAELSRVLPFAFTSHPSGPHNLTLELEAG